MGSVWVARSRRHRLVLPVLLCALLAIPVGLGAAPHHAVSPAAPSHLATPTSSPAPRAPIPSAGPGCVPGTYPEYAPLAGGLDPIAPNYATQSPCKLAFDGYTHDEVHATFSSSLANSSDHVRFPMHFPTEGNPGVPTLFDDLFVGMVVVGDNKSIGNQSYAEIVFKPVSEAGGQVNYTPIVSIWSVHTNASAGTCPAGLNYTWDGGFACEVQMDQSSGDTLTTDVRGGDFVNVTFVGSPSDTTGLTVYVNDSTAAFGESQQLSAASTLTKTFEPEWSAACPDTCRLNWSFPFGLGFGYDMCAAPPTCNSYNNTTMTGSAPVTFFSPEFWNGSGYGGDYRYFAPESATGACSGVGGVIPCTLVQIDGDYPYFTFNGSALALGPIWPWTRVDWGGAHQELDALGTANDSTPFFLQYVTNNSRAGYIPSGQPLVVTARAEDLGTVTKVLLNYTSPGGSLTSVPMTRVAGTPSDGVYNYTIPAPASNGKITYRVFAANRAGAQLTSPSPLSPPSEVTVGPLPHFTLWLNTTFAGCGGVLLNGTVWPTFTSLSIFPGAYPVVGVGCYKYIFRGWESTGGAGVWPNAAASTLVLSASGSLLVLDQYVRPFDQIVVSSSPSCGSVVFNGTGYSGSTIVTVPDNASYSLGYTGCGAMSFAGWTVDTPAIAINGSSVFILSNGSITSNWISSASAVQLLLLVNPAQSGGVLFRGAGYLSGTTLNLTQGQSYSIHQSPFGGWGFSNWSTNGPVTLGGGQIILNGPGTVTANDYRLTLVHVLVSPPGGGYLVLDSGTYLNGASVNVTNNTVHSIFAHANAGYLFLSFGGSPVTALTVNGNTLTVNGSGTLTVNFEQGSGTAFVAFQTDPPGCGTIEFNGANYTNSQFTEVAPNLQVGVTAWACAGFGFVKWIPSGGVAVNSLLLSPTTAIIAPTGGSIKAEFHALAVVRIFTTPASCGTVTIDGVPHQSGGSTQLPIYAWSFLSQTPCADYHFIGWVNSTGSTINSTSIYIVGPTLLTANYARDTYGVTVLVNPATCGSLKVGSAEVFNNTTLVLTSGRYPLSASPCPTNELLGFNTSGGVLVANGSLLVSGAGGVAVNYGPVPPRASLSLPSSSYSGSSVYLTVQVAVPVAPFTYTYDWTFGDGGGAVTQGNFTNHVFSSTGTYTVHVRVTDPYARQTNSSGTISIVPKPPETTSLPWAGFVILGLVAVLLIAAVAVASRRRSHAQRASTSAGPPPNVQEPPALPPMAAESPSLSSGKETDEANRSN
ncbi:MAG: PKD domain-containing protein [Thermoplasmata archaeon]|nr:PKD domain-containing protein [Thermoplasmata archaeon]